MSRLAAVPAALLAPMLLIDALAAAPAGTESVYDWIVDAEAGCAVRNLTPAPGQTIVYNGGCIDGFAEGPGRTRWYVDGKLSSIYKGDYRRGRRHGQGVYLFPDGSRYSGGFVNGQRHGRGVRTWPNGDRFEGGFRNGRRDGPGVIDYADGQRYEGPYADGKPHGDGTCYTPARGTWPCRWEHGKLIR